MLISRTCTEPTSEEFKNILLKILLMSIYLFTGKMPITQKSKKDIDVIAMERPLDKRRYGKLFI
ncbi:MAG: hypothetical protein ACRCR9_01600 [Chitinophagaceae bacterium]